MNNGNLHVDIPLLDRPGRHISEHLHYIYDSKGWYFHQVVIPSVGGADPRVVDTPAPAPGNNMQWTITGSAAIVAGTNPSPPSSICTYNQDQPVVGYVPSGYYVKDQDGTRHRFPDPSITFGAPQGTSSAATCYAQPIRLYASDGSGWILDLDGSGSPVRAFSPDGLLVKFTPTRFAPYNEASSVEDANGNQLVVNGSDTLGSPVGYGAVQYIDTSGTGRAFASLLSSITVHTALCSFHQDTSCSGSIRALSIRFSRSHYPMGRRIHLPMSPMDMEHSLR